MTETVHRALDRVTGLEREIPTAIALVSGEGGTPAWTPENDFLTSTMKLKRPIIAKAFTAEIDDCYARSA